MLHLRERRRQPEIMDQPGLDEHSHTSALKTLARINWWSGSASILWPPLKTLTESLPKRSLRVLDVATGGGDLPIRLWCRSRRDQVDLQVDGCDVSDTALDYARRRAQATDAAVRFFKLDVIQDDLPTDYDAILCSLFLHHLDEHQAVEVLRRMSQAAKHMVLINDLCRSRRGLLLAYFATYILTPTSWVARSDGPRSVEGAFTPEEARALASQAGLDGAAIERRFPQRFLLTWRRPA